MKEQVVDVARREACGKNISRRLRRGGQIPAVLYGAGKEPIPLVVDPRRLVEIIQSESGANTLFQLNMAGTEQRRHVMIKEYQVDPIEGHLLHADFVRIQMDEVIEVDVPVALTGEAAGVKLDGGILEVVTRNVRISCLPADIPDHVDIDISPMKIGDNLKVSDLGKSDRYKVVSDPGLILAVCAAPAKEEVVAPAAEVAAPTATEPEVIKKGKAVAEGEEGAVAEGEDKKKEAKKPEGKK
jgi:large subunit ribosomal protein L25